MAKGGSATAVASAKKGKGTSAKTRSATKGGGSATQKKKTPARATKAPSADGAKKRRKVPVRSLGTHIHKLFAKEWPEHQITGKAVWLLNDLIDDLKRRLDIEASLLTKGIKTLTRQTVETSVRVVFPRELTKEAMSWIVTASSQASSK